MGKLEKKRKENNPDPARFMTHEQSIIPPQSNTDQISSLSPIHQLDGSYLKTLDDRIYS